MDILKVLVIDDDPVCLKSVKSLLSTQYGYEVDVVESPVDALNRLYAMAMEWEPKWYDLILMDINMPVVKGDVLTKIIRQTETNMQNTPIIAITGRLAKGQETRLLKKGITDIILKPITSDKINLIVEKYFTTSL